MNTTRTNSFLNWGMRCWFTFYFHSPAKPRSHVFERDQQDVRGMLWCVLLTEYHFKCYKKCTYSAEKRHAV
jgi:hypothetical protein